MRQLLAKLKIIIDNVKILHRNVVGIEWLYVHPHLEEYYKKLLEMEDDISEMMIFLGEDDINILDSINYYKSINIKKYTTRETYIFIQHFFSDLIEESSKCRDLLPPDCQGKLDEYIYWLRKEVYYKINSLLS